MFGASKNITLVISSSVRKSYRNTRYSYWAEFCENLHEGRQRLDFHSKSSALLIVSPNALYNLFDIMKWNAGFVEICCPCVQFEHLQLTRFGTRLINIGSWRFFCFVLFCFDLIFSQNQDHQIFDRHGSSLFLSSFVLPILSSLFVSRLLYIHIYFLSSFCSNV